MSPKNLLRTCLFIVLAAICAACGNKLIRGEAPIVQINELSQSGDEVSIHLSLRNLNGVALDVRGIDFRLSAEDDVLYAFQGPATTNIAANGTETLTVKLANNTTSRQLLERLQNGEIKSLPYSLEGTVGTAAEGDLRFQHEGHMYPVPGRPGHFR